jgi:hypothetical protein
LNSGSFFGAAQLANISAGNMTRKTIVTSIDQSKRLGIAPELPGTRFQAGNGSRGGGDEGQKKRPIREEIGR